MLAGTAGQMGILSGTLTGRQLVSRCIRLVVSTVAIAKERSWQTLGKGVKEQYGGVSGSFIVMRRTVKSSFVLRLELKGSATSCLRGAISSPGLSSMLGSQLENRKSPSSLHLDWLRGCERTSEPQPCVHVCLEMN